MKPKIYMAGKISKNDWRHDMVPGLRGHPLSGGPIDCETFDYTGPFFVACDHGCSHGPNLHGALGHCTHDDDAPARGMRREVIDRNNAALDASNLVFAYITAADCYGTLNEIGRANGRGIPVVMYFAPDVVIPHEFWVSSLQAEDAQTNVRNCCLPELLRDAIGRIAARCTTSKGVLQI